MKVYIPEGYKSILGMYDTQTLLVGLDANLWGLGNDVRYDYADIGISIHYPFGRKFIAPYIGGGLSYHLNSLPGLKRIPTRTPAAVSAYSVVQA